MRLGRVLERENTGKMKGNAPRQREDGRGESKSSKKCIRGQVLMFWSGVPFL